MVLLPRSKEYQPSDKNIPEDKIRNVATKIDELNPQGRCTKMANLDSNWVVS